MNKTTTATIIQLLDNLSNSAQELANIATQFGALLQDSYSNIEKLLANAKELLKEDIVSTGNIEKEIVNVQPSVSSQKKFKFSRAESIPADLLPLMPDGLTWPEAFDPLMITGSTDADKFFRAQQIIRWIGESLATLNVLDIGCGEGHLAQEIGAVCNAHTVTAYDINQYPQWSNFKKASFTIDKSDLRQSGYDAIVLYDVLDHLEGDDPVSFMAWLASLLTPNGKIFVRTHPWTSKHGGHLYEQGYNQAFLHLALTVDEMAKAGISLLPNLRFNRPMAAYETIFREAGLNNIKRIGSVEKVNPFFSGDILDRIVKVTWGGKISNEEALKIMANSFVDYRLVKS